jgi:hypothetical protein
MPSDLDFSAYAEQQTLIDLHPPGLPLLLAPAYALAGPLGARLLIALAAASAGAMLYLLLIRLEFSRGLALAGWALLSFSAAWWTHAAALFGDLFAGLLILMLLAAWLRSAPAWGGWFALAALPWLNIRFLPLALAGALAHFILFRRGRAAGLALVSFSLLGISLWNYHTWGDAGLLAAHRANNFETHTLIEPLRNLNALAAACSIPNMDSLYGDPSGS